MGFTEYKVKLKIQKYQGKKIQEKIKRIENKGVL